MKEITLNGAEVTTVIFTTGDRYYLYGVGEASDVPPGPIKLQDVNFDSGDDKFFAFYVEDCAFPPMFVVQSDSFENAYDEFIDWQENLIKIDDGDLPAEGSEEWQSLNYNNKGTPINTEGIRGHEVKLVAAFTDSGDVSFWNIATMLLDQVTRYENQYTDSPDAFKRKVEGAVWEEARDLRHHKING